MSETRALLNNTITFSSVDGPGNRFVIFLQGCNFNCVTCHNPYTITPCTSCGVCVLPCPEHALTILSGPLVIVDRAVCTSCEICIDVCPTDSTPLAAETTVASLVDQIRSAAPFLTGVTISGGEATMQAEFVRELFAAIKGDTELQHLSTLVDTNGSADDQVWESLLDVMDGAMVDLKAIDPAVHVNLTARDNTRVLSSIRFLSERDKLEEIRLLIVPGYNDGHDAIERTARWLADLDVDPKIKIIGYRSHGVRTEADHIPDATRASLDDIAMVLAEHGLEDLTVV